LFESVFQVVTWVGIAVAIAAIFYFLSKDNLRGAIWSSAALACAVAVMLAIIADRYFVHRAINRTSSSGPAPAPALDPNLARDNLAVEEFRARLSIQQSVMTDDILPGKKPSVTFTITNTGKTAAEKITTAFVANVTPVLPRWEPNELDAALVGRGERAPERDEFYSTTLEPNTSKSITVPFSELWGYVSAMSSQGKKGEFLLPGNISDFGPERRPVQMRVFFVGAVDYQTMGRKYRLRVCHTPKAYPGKELVECGQWNKTEELALGQPDDFEGRRARKVTADIGAVLTLMDKTGKPTKTPTDDAYIEAIFFNFGPTMATDVRIKWSIGIAGGNRSPGSLPTGSAYGQAGTPPLRTHSLRFLIGSDGVQAVITGKAALTLEVDVDLIDAWKVEHHKNEVHTFNMTTGRFDSLIQPPPTPRPNLRMPSSIEIAPKDRR
jgi:hypothetical protein